MSESYDLFKSIMQDNTDGHDVDIRYGAPEFQFPAVRIFKYFDFPGSGDLTCVTYGLSHADHPDWSGEKPELAIQVSSGISLWGG